jgi:hypothetical protein
LIIQLTINNNSSKDNKTVAIMKFNKS